MPRKDKGTRVGKTESQLGLAPKRKYRRKTTVNDLLTEDSVNTVFERIAEKRPEMSSLFAIYEDRTGNILWEVDTDTDLSKVIFLLESVKYCLLSGEDE